jgi:hypothetical protein
MNLKVWVGGFNSTNEGCYAAKGKKTCTCFKAPLKFVNFIIPQQKMSQ